VKLRLQFGLRSLLGFVVVVCLLLGALHLLERYGSYLEVGRVNADNKARVKGRLVRILGPSTCRLAISGRIVGDNSAVCGLGRFVERSWLCCYEFNFASAPIKKPGEWTFDAYIYPKSIDANIPPAAQKRVVLTIELPRDSAVNSQD
jgi:hypothetical protein